MLNYQDLNFPAIGPLPSYASLSLNFLKRNQYETLFIYNFVDNRITTF